MYATPKSINSTIASGSRELYAARELKIFPIGRARYIHNLSISKKNLDSEKQATQPPTDHSEDHPHRETRYMQNVRNTHRLRATNVSATKPTTAKITPHREINTYTKPQEQHGFKATGAPAQFHPQ
jgi:hypothetical protein